MRQGALQPPDGQPHRAVVDEGHDGHPDEAATQQTDANIHDRFDHLTEIRKKGATQACAAKWLAPVKGQSGAAWLYNAKFKYAQHMRNERPGLTDEQWKRKG